MPPVATAPRALELTAREHEVLDRLAQGQAQTEIAEALVIRPKTVASHVQRILAKRGVHSRAQAVAAAYQLGIDRRARARARRRFLAVDDDLVARAGRLRQRPLTEKCM
jgi:DNA-binding CsgD family transcriptional regulator